MVASCVSSRTVFSPSPQGTTILTVLKLTVTFISPLPEPRISQSQYLSTKCNLKLIGSRQCFGIASILKLLFLSLVRVWFTVQLNVYTFHRAFSSYFSLAYLRPPSNLNFFDTLLSFLKQFFSVNFRQISEPFSMFSNTKHNIFNGLKLMFGLAVKDGGLHFPANDDKPAKPWRGPQHWKVSCLSDSQTVFVKNKTSPNQWASHLLGSH